MRTLHSRRAVLFAASGVVVAAQTVDGRPLVVLRTSKGEIRVELFPEIAPKTVANFLGYVESGFYDDTAFHRVIEGFVVQGGGFTPELHPKPTGNPVRVETRNGMVNERGTIAMARMSGRSTATSQFFFNLSDNPNLNRSGGQFGYTVFGRVVEGMDVVDQIARVQTSRRGPMEDVPILPVILETAARER